MTLSDYCTAARRDGKLIIEIPEEEILKEIGTQEIPFARVTDRSKLLTRVAELILHTEHPHENYETNLDHLVRAALRNAVEDFAGAVTDNIVDLPEEADDDAPYRDGYPED